MWLMTAWYQGNVIDGKKRKLVEQCKSIEIFNTVDTKRREQVKLERFENMQMIRAQPIGKWEFSSICKYLSFVDIPMLIKGTGQYKHISKQQRI